VTLDLDGIPLCPTCLAASLARTPLPPRCEDRDGLTEPDLPVAAPQRITGASAGGGEGGAMGAPHERPETALEGHRGAAPWHWGCRYGTLRHGSMTRPPKEKRSAS
jgi:hypothetical protein